MMNTFNSIVVFSLILQVVTWVAGTSPTFDADPTPPTWPDQLHMTVVTNRGGNLTLDEIYYNYPIKKNFILITHQQPSIEPTYDLETNGGATYYYSKIAKTCFIINMPVGILRPNWLQGSR
eukprot:m.102724 g.102724  ORF g.102724 m.102724 type:complete len:121 (-) comp27429_c0_seq1:135-497(-)